MSYRDFKQVFRKSQPVATRHMPLVLRCNNIDFGHVDWPASFYSILNQNNKIMIIDIHVHDNNNTINYTFINGILKHGNIQTVMYMINNRCISNYSFSCARPHKYGNVAIVSLYNNAKNLTGFLTSISLGRFAGYYNLERYHYMIHTMLLITKVRTVLPKNVIKHLIIPFIYQ